MPVRELNHESLPSLKKSLEESNGKIALIVHPNYDEKAFGFNQYKKRLHSFLEKFEGPVVFWSENAGNDLNEFERFSGSAYYLPTLKKTPIPEKDWFESFRPEEYGDLKEPYERAVAVYSRQKNHYDVLRRSLGAVARALHEAGARKVWLGGQYSSRRSGEKPLQGSLNEEREIESWNRFVSSLDSLEKIGRVEDAREKRGFSGKQFTENAKRSLYFDHSQCVGWVWRAFQKHSPRFKVVKAMPEVSTI
jgi:hypothetical protein